MSRSGASGGDSRREAEAPLELESQFILRMPEEPAKVLRDLLRSGANLKDGCSIRLENDMRYGEVRVDRWLMHAKVVDLPTIVESLKTIDNKSFYKTADICQMMICKEEADQPTADDEGAKNKKRDPFKVEKKFLWPHGITPPSKNVRKRRFRKTLKKKYVEAPEIEKEVKRLLRIDNDAASVKWEVLSEEEEQANKAESGGNADTDRPEVSVKKEKTTRPKPESKTVKREPSAKNRPVDPDAPNVDVEHDIFGGAVSDSDEEMGSNLNVEMNDNSRLSEYDSRLSDSNSMQSSQVAGAKSQLPTQFASNMFQGNEGNKWHNSPSDGNSARINRQMHTPAVDSYQNQELNKENTQIQLENLNAELESLRTQRAKKEQEIASMENLALKHRFQELLDNLSQEIAYKEMEYRKLQRKTDGE